MLSTTPSVWRAAVGATSKVPRGYPPGPPTAEAPVVRSTATQIDWNGTARSSSSRTVPLLAVSSTTCCRGTMVAECSAISRATLNHTTLPPGVIPDATTAAVSKLITGVMVAALGTAETANKTHEKRKARSSTIGAPPDDNIFGGGGTVQPFPPNCKRWKKPSLYECAASNRGRARSRWIKYSPAAITIAAPVSIRVPGRVDQNSQSSDTPQPMAVYSKGATTDASPVRNASVTAYCPRAPVKATTTSTGQCSDRKLTHPGAARHQGGNPDLHASGRVGAAEHAHGDGAERVARRGGERGNAGEGQRPRPGRPQHHQPADESAGDGDPAPRGDVLAEERHRHRGDEQRRDEEDRIGVRERQRTHRVDEAGEHEHRHQAAGDLQQPAHLHHLPQTAAQQEADEHAGQRRHAAHRRHLQRRVVRREPLHRRVHHRQHADGEDHPGDGAEVAAALRGRHADQLATARGGGAGPDTQPGRNNPAAP